MAKDPAFLFYPGDWLGGTLGMTFEQKGAYIELLMLQFNRGHMTEHMIRHTVGQLWDNLKDKFRMDDKGCYYNERLEIEKENRKVFVESRRNNVSGTNQYTKKKEKKSGHTTSHMEDEDINENKDLNKNKKTPTQEEFLAYCKELIPEEYQGLEFGLKGKYIQWSDANWKDGNGLKITNWKNKIQNTIPFLKPLYKKKHDTNKQSNTTANIESGKDYGTL